ncbi:MAG: septal ring lytic transglycosylase RlpA family protein, partial [Kordiimonas sp.]
YDEVGYASWYGKDFHGKKTANGEYFNMNALTAAHKTLPLPTFVKVTNLNNGRTLVLRVNDRGPFVGDRIIDISRRGAQLLGFQKQGLTKVRIQAVDENGKLVRSNRRPANVATPPVVAETIAKPKTTLQTAEALTHYIQVGSFSQRSNAEVQARKLGRTGHRARVEQANNGSSSFWRVRVGPFVERIIAEQRLDRIVADGFYEARIFSEAVN